MKFNLHQTKRSWVRLKLMLLFQKFAHFSAPFRMNFQSLQASFHCINQQCLRYGAYSERRICSRTDLPEQIVWKSIPVSCLDDWVKWQKLMSNCKMHVIVIWYSAWFSLSLHPSISLFRPFTACDESTLASLWMKS